MRVTKPGARTPRGHHGRVRRHLALLGLLVAVALVPTTGAHGSVAAPSSRDADQGEPAMAQSTPEQSPVRLSPGGATPRQDLPALRFEYSTAAAATVRYVSDDADQPGGCHRRGAEETVRADLADGAGTLWVGEVAYQLGQVHWHTPAEHVVNSVRHPLEQHLVHEGPDGRLLVVGVLIATGHTSAHGQLGRLLAAAPPECAPAVPVAGVNLTRLLPPATANYRYLGSLTTAPYTTGVSWIVLTRPLLAGAAELAPFRQLFSAGNSRAVQPLGGRSVGLARG